MPALAFAQFSPIEKGFLLGSIVVGAGLLAVRRWAWRAFVVYAPAFAILDIYGFANAPTWFNAGALAETVFAFGAMAYFIRRDIFAPYLAEQDRGFRDRTRHNMTVPVLVDRVQHSRGT